MRISLVSAGLACVGVSSAAVKSLRQRQSANEALPALAGYNFTMPVDHFSAGDQRTYQNLYYVNDTYYENGGPVILYNNGEASFDAAQAAALMAEVGEDSALMQLAKRLKGVAIGWEHRYYGQSLPVPFSDTGLPADGVDGYKYLTLEQSMEDMVYFANNFNKTTLSANHVIQSTANLDPYHIPWIYMGGSYPGALGAWARVRNPEIFYATWSSSAPVEARYDGSIYFNPIYRALPSNCTTDMKAIIESFDSFVSTASQADLSAFLYTVNSTDSIAMPFDHSSPAVAGYQLATTMVALYQYVGPSKSLQGFCDMLESFDGVEYLKTISPNSYGFSQIFANPLTDPFSRQAAQNGIVDAYGDQGIVVGQAAFFYAFNTYTSGLKQSLEQFGGESNPGDSFSWIWQTVAELGYFKGYNETSNKGMQFVMNVSDTTAAHDLDAEPFVAAFGASAVPNQPDVSLALKYGGWNMKPSNVMFTNGELDPWTAFGVMSKETNAGAPQRNVVQTVPSCNKAPSGTDVFGMLFADHVHTSDILGKSDNPDSPLSQAVDLFVQAYNTWQPCFAKSRDDVRNGKAPDGSDKQNAAGRHGPRSGAVWAIVGLASYVMYNVL